MWDNNVCGLGIPLLLTKLVKASYSSCALTGHSNGASASLLAITVNPSNSSDRSTVSPVGRVAANAANPLIHVSPNATA